MPKQLPHNAGHTQFSDSSGAVLHVEPINTVAVTRLGPAVFLNTSPGGTYVALDKVEDLIAAIRDAASVVAHRDGKLCADPDCGRCSFDRAFAEDS